MNDNFALRVLRSQLAVQRQNLRVAREQEAGKRKAMEEFKAEADGHEIAVGELEMAIRLMEKETSDE